MTHYAADRHGLQASVCRACGSLCQSTVAEPVSSRSSRPRRPGRSHPHHAGYLRETCYTSATVRALLLANAPGGRAWSGRAQLFVQDAVLDDQLLGSALSPASAFEGTASCGSRPLYAALPPDQVLRDEHRWRATTAFGTPRDAEAPLPARFGFSLDPVGDPTAYRPLTTVETRAPLRLTGGSVGGISAPAAVDVALGQPAFAAFVEDSDPQQWLPPHERIEDGARITPTRVDDVPAFEVRLTKTVAGGRSSAGWVLMARDDRRVLGQQVSSR